MIVYSRFNSNRKKEFQLSTLIEKSNNNLVISKNAVTKVAQPFLSTLIDNYEKLKIELVPFKVLLPTKVNDNKVCFEYIHGDSLYGILRLALISRDKAKFLETISKYCDLIRAIKSVDYLPCTKFIEIFGNSLTRSLNSQVAGCLDLNFDNIFVKNNQAVVFDYEWVFNFPIPNDFILFRAIINFYGNNKCYFPNSLVNIFELFEICKIQKELLATFFEFENNFQTFVYGKNTCGNNVIELLADDNYFESESTKVEKLTTRIEKLEIEDRKKNNWILKLEKDNQELQELFNKKRSVFLKLIGK